VVFLSELQLIDIAGMNVFLRQFDPVKYTQQQVEVYGIELPESLQYAVVKRQAEFVAGRVVAGDGLAALGLSRVEIPIGPHRSPVWPEGVIGSISHNNCLAVATVRLQQEGRFVGIDVETMIPDVQCTDIKRMILHSDDYKYLTLNQLSQSQLMTLIFSAKESLFKAVYPSIKRYLEFHDARVVGLNVAEKKMGLELLVETAGLMIPQQYEVDFYWLGECVITLIQSPH
jgi:enterobactin synthetase component D